MICNDLTLLISPKYKGIFEPSFIKIIEKIRYLRFPEW